MMKKIILLISISGLVFAGKLAEKKAMKEAMAGAKKAEASIMKSCGASVSYNFEKLNAKDLEKQSISGRIDDVASGITQVCNVGKDEKDAVKSSISKIKMVFDTSIKKKIKLALKNKELVVNYNWDSSNIYQTIREWLKNNL